MRQSLACAGGAGWSIRYTYRKTYIFDGLTDRYHFNAYNRRGIDEHLPRPMKVLCAEFLNILDETATIARRLQPEQYELASEMPIYNRPVKIVEAMGIMMFHAGLHHSTRSRNIRCPCPGQLSPEIQHAWSARHAGAGALSLISW
jgi:hypothetical protein